MKKRWMSMVVAGCLCLGMVPAMPAKTVWAAEGKLRSLDQGANYNTVIKEDGSLWAWGSDYYGLLGNGAGANEEPSGFEEPTKVLENVASVSSYMDCMAVIKTDASLWVWGSPIDSALWVWEDGNGGISYDKATKIMDDVASVSVGFDHIAVIKKDGSLWILGNDIGAEVDFQETKYDESGMPVFQYQAGDITYSEDEYKKRTETFRKVMDNVSEVMAGDGYTIAIKEDGSLWAWGRNSYGQLGTGTQGYVYEPTKILDEVDMAWIDEGCTLVVKKDGSLWRSGSDPLDQKDFYEDRLKTSTQTFTKIDEVGSGIKYVSACDGNIAVLKLDNSLWMWGYNRSGQFGNGSKSEEKTINPIKVAENVTEVLASWGQTIIVKTDGSLWVCGSNEWGQLGDGTTEERLNFVKIMDGVRVANRDEKGTTQIPNSSDEYIYDIQDPAEDMILPTDVLDKVKDITSAMKATEATVQGMTQEQKQSATGIDLATLSAETATARAAAKPVSGNEIIIDKASVSDLQAVAAEASTAVENTLVNGGVTPARALSKTVTLTSDSTDELSIRIEPDILSAGVDKVRVETPSCALTFKISDLEADLSKPLTVTLQEIGTNTTEKMNTTGTMAVGMRNLAEGYETIDNGISDILMLANPVKKVKVNFPGGKMTNAVTVSLPSGGGDKTYQAVVKDDGKATASKYNPATTAIDGKINTSGTYTVQTNQKNFSDIANKSAEMQKAIRYLASKGIINGTTETTFSPDQTISRAQIASLMVQALGKMDNSATANFKDVPKNAWYYHQAASSQKHGLFSGYEDNTFRGGNAIQKDQLVNVTGNVLVKEMGYKAPGNPSAYLSKYSDNVAGWAQPMVALATKENLVVYRTNGTFGGKGTMTRGDAAIIIYRLFMKIW